MERDQHELVNTPERETKQKKKAVFSFCIALLASLFLFISTKILVSTQRLTGISDITVCLYISLHFIKVFITGFMNKKTGKESSWIA
jgi:hypothetical protein